MIHPDMRNSVQILDLHNLMQAHYLCSNNCHGPTDSPADFVILIFPMHRVSQFYTAPSSA